MRRLAAGSRPARGSAAPHRRRRDGERRGRRGAGGRRFAGAGALAVVEIVALGRFGRRARPRARERRRARRRRRDPPSSGRTCSPGRAGAADVSPFDLVLANLPYVRRDAMPGLPVAASFEPALALDGGVGRAGGHRPAAGAAARRRWPRDGVALLEIGADQGEAIVERCAEIAARLVVPGGAGPGRPAARGADPARLTRTAPVRSPRRSRRPPLRRRPPVGHHLGVPIRTDTRNRSCPSSSSRSTSTARSSATTWSSDRDTAGRPWPSAMRRGVLVSHRHRADGVERACASPASSG